MNSLILMAPGLFMAMSPTAQRLPSVSSLVPPLVVVLLLIFINGLFVAAEFAIIGVRDTEMEQLADEGYVVAGRVLQILEMRPRMDRYIATAELGVVLATLGLAMYGVPAIGRFIQPYLQAIGLNPVVSTWAALILALAFLIWLYIVLGEMVPKSLALSNPPAMAMALNRFMRLAGALLSVPVRLLNGVGGLLLRLFRITPAQGHERLLAAEELELIVVESAEGGLIEDDEEEIIRNIFDFSERTVGQVMTPRRKVQSLPIDCRQADLIRTVTRSHHSRFPIYEDDPDHIVGILHLKDLIRLTLRPNGPFDLRLILRSAPEVPEDFRVDRLLAAFKNEKLHMAIVRDEFGGMAGVVTLEDLVEEVVGEVRDEFDVEREPYFEVSPGVLELSGDYLLDDLADDVFLGEEDELPDVETVGGLIVSLLGRPPAKGDTVIYHDNIRFTVLDIDRLAIVRARVEYPHAARAGASPDEQDPEAG
ncbi:MAG: HlyC/CorC family transporter [Candidatus Promineofilum sp.]|nr:HlyC/CorC family transporter [Promineifilum sp.]MBP9657910.1 HlyC/CorC family transporter [Promineifilum sp.]